MKEYYLGSGGRRLVGEGPFVVRSRNAGVPDLTAEYGFVLVRGLGESGMFPMQLDELTPVKFSPLDIWVVDGIDRLFLHLPGRSEDLAKNRASFQNTL